MNEEIWKVLNNIEMRLQQCNILSQLLDVKQKGIDVDYERHFREGYTRDEVLVGEDLVDLFLKLKEVSGMR